MTYKLLFIILILVFIYKNTYRYTVTEKITDKIDVDNINYIHNIPLIIFRTWKNRYINGKMFDYCHKKWLKLNPRSQIVWFTDKQCNKFMKEFNFQGKGKDNDKDNNMIKIYDKIKPGAFKSDLWRLCVLYKYGGIYVDAHSTVFRSIEDIVYKYSMNRYDNKHVFISALDCKESCNGIHNGFMITSPKHPFIRQCIEDIIENVNNNEYTDHVLGVTGPICLKRSIQKVLGTTNEFVIGWNKFKDISFYLLRFEWGIHQYIYDKEHAIISKKYDILEYFNSKILKKKDGYAFMWKKHDIYNL